MDVHPPEKTHKRSPIKQYIARHKLLLGGVGVVLLLAAIGIATVSILTPSSQLAEQPALAAGQTTISKEKYQSLLKEAATQKV